MVRPITEWTTDDLERLISDQTPESLVLDYKQSATLKRTDAGKKELAKDVSSFANSAGGRIVIGIIEDNNKPTALDSGIDVSEWSRETIEQIIDTNITPRIAGLLIHPIPINGEKCFYVIDIPQATAAAPHQVVRDRRYYKRRNFTTIEMEDYEIRDTMRRSTNPDLYLDLEMISGPIERSDTADLVQLQISTRNESLTPATYVLLRLGFKRGIIVNFSQSGLLGWNNPAEFTASDGQSFDVYRKNITPNNHLPIYREENFGHGITTIYVPIETDRVGFFGAASSPGCLRTCSGHIERVDDRFRIVQYGTVPE